METLKPQFVPGQSIASTTTITSNIEEKLSHLQILQENDNLKSQVLHFFIYQINSILRRLLKYILFLGTRFNRKG